jgi:hypothetical protein
MKTDDISANPSSSVSSVFTSTSGAVYVPKKEIAPRRPKPSRRNLFTPRAAEAAARDAATAHVHAAVA